MLRLTKLREGQGLSKSRLARMADLDQALVGKVESGRQRPYKGQLERLARALGLPACDSSRLLEAAGEEHNAGD